SAPSWAPSPSAWSSASASAPARAAAPAAPPTADRGSVPGEEGPGGWTERGRATRDDREPGYRSRTEYSSRKRPVSLWLEARVGRGSAA
ncbi:hypothetical protein DF186_17420, partial [Enterococcus hirae]